MLIQHHRRSRRSPLTRLTAALGLVALIALAGAPAGAATPPPQLSIAIDDGVASATEGDELAYTITVQNLGAAAVEGLHVTQTMPEGLAFERADPEGTASDEGRTWTLDLAADASATFATVAAVEATPDELLRLASVVCAAVGADGAPLVCASDSDLLPAGRAEQEEAAAAPGGAVDPPAPSPSSGGNGSLVVVAAGALVLGLGAAAVVTARRRRVPTPVVS